MIHVDPIRVSMDELARRQVRHGRGGTLHPVTRPRGELDADRRKQLARLAGKAEAAKTDLRTAALAALADGGSFAWVAEVTGLSTNTLQRWKREEQQRP